jgi:hypothetical protein
VVIVGVVSVLVSMEVALEDEYPPCHRKCDQSDTKRMTKDHGALFVSRNTTAVPIALSGELKGGSFVATMALLLRYS